MKLSFCLLTLSVASQPTSYPTRYPTGPVAGDHCPNAIDLGQETSPLSGTNQYAFDDFRTNFPYPNLLTCTWNSASGGSAYNTAKDMIYKIDVPAGHKLTIRQTTNSFDSRHELRWGDSSDCPGPNLVSCLDDLDTEPMEWTNDEATTKTAYFIIDAYSSTWNSEGTYTLDWSVTYTPPVCPVSCVLEPYTNLQRSHSPDVTSPYNYEGDAANTHSQFNDAGFKIRVVHDVNLLNQQLAGDKHRCYREAGSTTSCKCECHNLEVNNNPHNSNKNGDNAFPVYTSTKHAIYNPWAEHVDVKSTGHDLADFWANVRHGQQSPSTQSQVAANRHEHDRSGLTTQEGAWEVTTNANCHVRVTNDGHCVEDVSGPNVNYGNDESCTFSYKPVDTAPVTLHKVTFDMEENSNCNWDYLQIDGQKYCNGPNILPDQLALEPGRDTVFKYYTDYSVVHDGFKICDMQM